MEQMSGNDEGPGIDLGDSLQQNNWILYSGATCHMIPQVSYFITGSFEDTDKKLKLRMIIKSRKSQKDEFK